VTGEVCELDGAIKNITKLLLSTKWKLALITGGPSVGKSFFLYSELLSQYKALPTLGSPVILTLVYVFGLKKIIVIPNINRGKTKYSRKDIPSKNVPFKRPLRPPSFSPPKASKCRQEILIHPPQD